MFTSQDYCQFQYPEFNPWNPGGKKKREPTFTICPLTSTHTHIQECNKDFYKITIYIYFSFEARLEVLQQYSLSGNVCGSIARDPAWGRQAGRYVLPPVKCSSLYSVNNPLKKI